MNWKRVGIVVALLILAVPSVVAQKYTEPGSPKQDETYGNTPEEIVPYRQFGEPYKHFFADEQLFLGTGREKPPPPGLEAVKIGFLGPLEGSHEAPFGQAMLQGCQLALEEANARGGYQGLPFELVVRDDVGPWGASSNKMVELHDEQVWAVLGSIDGASTHIALRVALKAELPMVTTGSTDPTLTETRIPWYVRVNADDRQNSYALAAYVFQEKGYERVAVLRVNDRYGRVGIGEFRDAARRLGKPLLFELRYAQGDTEFSAQLEKIKRSSADAVVLWGHPAELGHIVKQMRAMGMDHPVFGADRMVDDTFLEVAGPAAEGVVAAALYNPERDDPVLKGFQQRYQNRFGEAPDAFAAHAYDGMNLIIEAIGEAGLNRTRIRDWMTGLDRYHGVTGVIPFDPSWNDVGPVWLTEVRDGTYHYFPSPLMR